MSSEEIIGSNGEKAKEYNAETAILKEDLICATTRTPEGYIACYINKATRDELEISLARIQFRLMQVFAQIEVSIAKQQLTTPKNDKHGVLNFVRSKLRK